MTATLEPSIENSAASERPPQPAIHATRRDVYVDDPRRKSVLLASALSLMPGLGQIYVGYYPQGFTNVLVMCGLFALGGLGVYDGGLEPVGVIFGLFFWFYNIVDAGRRANLYNQSLAGLRPMDLPEDSKAPGWRGSLGGGLALVIAGAVLFAHTKFGMPLEWVRDWWPLGLVGVGLWLIYAHWTSKTPENT